MATSASKSVTLVLLIALGSLGSAQQRQKQERLVAESPTPKLPRLISLDEGMAIIGATLQVRYRGHPREDCSHLVHDIYEKAGFPYRYVDSGELYQGIDAFRQVTHPQPGDLAVWKGHAAIVVNPAQHTFFSSTRAGLKVQSYDLMYWKRRGTPRFFRYATMAPPSLPAIIQAAETEGSN
jgi:cell wall-associated NlpC family hydrolase